MKREYLPSRGLQVCHYFTVLNLACMRAVLHFTKGEKHCS